MIRRPPRSTPSNSSAASDVYKRQHCAGDVPLKATRGMSSRTPGDVISRHSRLKTRGACFKRPQYGQTWLACYWTGDSPGPACTKIAEVSGVVSWENGHLHKQLCKSPSATDPVTDFRAPRWRFFLAVTEDRAHTFGLWFVPSFCRCASAHHPSVAIACSRLEVMQSDVARLASDT